MYIQVDPIHEKCLCALDSIKALLKKSLQKASDNVYTLGRSERSVPHSGLTIICCGTVVVWHRTMGDVMPAVDSSANLT